jgi:histidine triad (HIT) family protein
VTLFEKIIARQIPADIVYEDEHTIAFRDINAQAPTHVLVVPKRVIPRLDAAEDADAELLGRCLLTVGRVAAQAGLSGYRVVINNGEEAGQTVFHLHLHLLGGRRFRWPPG